LDYSLKTKRGEVKKNSLKFYLIFAILIILSVVIDQITKVITTNKSIKIIGDFLQIYYTENTGVAFSFLSGKSWIFIPVSIISVIILIVLFILKKQKSMLFTISLSLIVGGAVGNVIDRVVLGYVRDFIYFNFFPAIFNFADSCVTIGTILLLVYLVFFFGKEVKNEKNI